MQAKWNSFRRSFGPGSRLFLSDHREPRRTAEKALAAVNQEAYLSMGISTRAVDDLVKALCGSGVSKSKASRLCQQIDAFLERPLEGDWPYLRIEAPIGRRTGKVASSR